MKREKIGDKVKSLYLLFWIFILVLLFGWRAVEADSDHEHHFIDPRSSQQLFAAEVQALAVPNLVAAYSFNENSGTIANDYSGNLNPATLINGPLWTTGKYGSAVSLDGTNDYLSIPDSSSLDLTAGTISGWVRLNSINRWHGLFAKGIANDDARGYNYGIEIEDTNLVQCFVGNGNAANNVKSTTPLTAGQFVHIACTWDGSNLRIYINGNLSNTNTQTIIPAVNAQALRIGNYGGVDYLQGIIDEVRIYNRALSQAEIQSDMSNAIS